MQWYEHIVYNDVYEDTEEQLEADGLSAAEDGFMRGYRNAAQI